MSDINTINDLIDELNNEMQHMDKYQIEHVVNKTLEFIFLGAIEY